MWAGTKLVCLGGLGLAITIEPTWRTIAITTPVVVLAVLVSRVPRGVAPRLPRWFWIGIGIASFLGLSAGGPPDLRLGGSTIGLGGLFEWARAMATFGLLAVGAALIGWTTPLADLGPALATLGRPLRPVRVPVDELVTAVVLAVRCLPLLVDEMRILQAARRVRRPVAPTGLRQRLHEVHDLLVTALVSAVRRAREMADAIEWRGGLGPVPTRPVRLRGPDAAAFAVVAVALVAVVAVR
jgi:energy-coupling factor transporter transmembrane protein EcfT